MRTSFSFKNIIEIMSSKQPKIIKVGKDDFINMMIENGATRKQAEFHANISEAMNSSVLIGKQKVKIKKQTLV